MKHPELPPGYSVFDYELYNGKWMVYAVDPEGVRVTIEFTQEGEPMAKEVGIPKNAPKAAKKADEALDKKKGIKEGSKADLKADKAIMAKFSKKGK